MKCSVAKKIVSLGMAAVLCCGLWACDGGKSAKENGKLKVVATVFAEYDFLRQIAGDTIDLSMLMVPGADIHTFDPTPKDMQIVQDADLFVTIGGESDAWAETVLESVDSKNLETVHLMDLVENVMEEEVVEGMEVEEHHHEEEEHHHEEEDHHHEEEEPELDEHVWTSPKNAIQIVEGLTDKLCELDKKHEKEYRQNGEAYVKELQALDEEFTQVVEQGNRKEIIVADRFPFRYFTEAYGLTYYAAFPGCSTQTGASAETVAFLVDKVKEDKIPLVFHMELSSETMCDSICDATGAKKAQLNAVHNISKTDFEKGIGYLDLMKENVSVLKEALQ